MVNFTIVFTSHTTLWYSNIYINQEYYTLVIEHKKKIKNFKNLVEVKFFSHTPRKLFIERHSILHMMPSIDY